MAPLVIGHLAVMIYAVQGGLTGAEILSRTQGSVWWALFYGLFVIAVSLHAAIGVRVVLHEALGVSGRALNLFTGVFAGVLLVLGASALAGVIL